MFIILLFVFFRTPFRCHLQQWPRVVLTFYFSFETFLASIVWFCGDLASSRRRSRLYLPWGMSNTCICLKEGVGRYLRRLDSTGIGLNFSSIRLCWSSDFASCRVLWVGDLTRIHRKRQTISSSLHQTCYPSPHHSLVIWALGQHRTVCRY